MNGRQKDGGRRIGEVARRAGVSADTVRYYERLGLVNPPRRAESGYRLYSDVELGRLRFIRRAKLLGLSLSDIHILLGLGEAGEYPALRRQVTGLLRQKLDECEVRLVELTAFKTELQGWYQLALERQDQPPASSVTFPESCTCLPVEIQEVDTGTTEERPHRRVQKQVARR